MNSPLRPTARGPSSTARQLIAIYHILSNAIIYSSSASIANSTFAIATATITITISTIATVDPIATIPIAAAAGGNHQGER